MTIAGVSFGSGGKFINSIGFNLWLGRFASESAFIAFVKNNYLGSKLVRKGFVMSFPIMVVAGKLFGRWLHKIITTIYQLIAKRAASFGQ